jgi:hypothetical protein
MLVGSGAVLGDGRPAVLDEASPGFLQLHSVLEARLDRPRAAILLVVDETSPAHHHPAVAPSRVTAPRPCSVGRRPEPMHEVEVPRGAAMLAGDPAERQPVRR